MLCPFDGKGTTWFEVEVVVKQVFQGFVQLTNAFVIEVLIFTGLRYDFEDAQQPPA